MDSLSLRATSSNPLPAGSTVAKLITRDRVALRYAVWRPESNRKNKRRIKGTICLFQGRTEFIEKYYEIIEALLDRGFVVATLDWRGQGLSDRRFKNRLRGYVRSFRHYHRDLEVFIKHVEQDCPGPYYALAHSMGGHIIFSASANGLAKFFNRVILTAPMLHLAPQSLIGFHRLRKAQPAKQNRIVSQRMTRLITSLIRFLGFGWAYPPGQKNQVLFPFQDNPLTSDPSRFDRVNELISEHRDLVLGGPTIAWAHSAFKSMSRILKTHFVKQIDVPMLIVASGADRVVSTPTIELISPRIRVGHHVVIHGARHEIMFERDALRDQFWAAFDAFITDADQDTAKHGEI